MLERSIVPPQPDAVAAARDYLRIDATGDDALIGDLVISAMERCEAAIGSVLIARAMRETIATTAAWRGLVAAPVKSITGVTRIDQAGGEGPIAAELYMIDLDSEGRGRVRFGGDIGSSRAVVRYVAGRFDSWAQVPTGLRQGMLRLVAHHYAYRQRDELPPLPTAIAALWAPERRLRLS